MANIDVKNSSSQQTDRQQNQGVTRRRQNDPFGFSLIPSEMFNTNPFSLMRRISEEMDRAFTGSVEGRGQGRGGMWSPAIEVSERDNKYVVSAELPGLNKDDVKVEVTEDAIMLHGERRMEHEENRGGIHRTERRYGEFHRTIPLPDGADSAQAKAQFRDGLLEITVPISEQRSKSRQIPIETASSAQNTINAGSEQKQTEARK